MLLHACPSRKMWQAYKSHTSDEMHLQKAGDVTHIIFMNMTSDAPV